MIFTNNILKLKVDADFILKLNYSLKISEDLSFGLKLRC